MSILIIIASAYGQLIFIDSTLALAGDVEDFAEIEVGPYNRPLRFLVAVERLAELGGRVKLAAKVGEAMPWLPPDDQWKTLATGTTIGASKTLRFEKVKARVFRLTIEEAVDVPTIAEFRLIEHKE